jgi:hypothetical protein
MRQRKQSFNKKSTPWKTGKFLFGSLRQAVFFLLASFLLAGCATKPWTEPLAEPEAGSVAQLVDSLVARDAGCGQTLEGDLVLFYQNPLDKKALSGFLQFSLPSSYKFVMANPFGQPVLVVAGDQNSFQAISTLEKKYLAGSLRSFGLHKDIPSYILKGDWAAWLTGRNRRPSQSITYIRNDRQSRGVWLTFQSTDQTGMDHLLLDRDREVFVDRIVENDHGRQVAVIRYGNWLTVGECRQPLEINITGLDYGTEIRIELSNVLLSDGQKTYRLQPPPGYARQFMP